MTKWDIGGYIGNIGNVGIMEKKIEATIWGLGFRIVLWMEEILHHLEPPNHCNSHDFGDLRWCRIPSTNTRASC